MARSSTVAESVIARPNPVARSRANVCAGLSFHVQPAHRTSPSAMPTLRLPCTVSRTTSSSVVVPVEEGLQAGVAQGRPCPASRVYCAELRRCEAPRLIMSRRSSFMIISSNRPRAALVAGVVAVVAAAAVVELACPARRPACRFSSISSSRARLELGRGSRRRSCAPAAGPGSPSTVAVIRNGSTPMSRRRVIVLGASLVCSVLNTMWPVSDACTAISAVSRSRISPTRILSGSCRRMDRRARGERHADVGVDRAPG